MKIKINREIEVPDGFICHGRYDCHALCKDINGAGWAAYCGNFGRYVFWPERAQFYVKCENCIHATMNYLNGVAK